MKNSGVRGCLKAAMVMMFVLSLVAIGSPSSLLAEPGGRDAAPVDPTEHGWEEVEPGVWTRVHPDGRVEQFARGAAGLAWALPRLKVTEADLLARYLEEPSEDRWEQLEDFNRMISETAAAIERGERGEREDSWSTKSDCHFAFGAAANAYPYYYGGAANASADWWNDCNYEGWVYCWAYAEADGVHRQRFDSANDDESTSCSASAVVVGDYDCESHATAWVSCPTCPGGGYYLERNDSNYSCPTCEGSGTSCSQHSDCGYPSPCTCGGGFCFESSCMCPE